MAFGISSPHHLLHFWLPSGGYEAFEQCQSQQSRVWPPVSRLHSWWFRDFIRMKLLWQIPFFFGWLVDFADSTRFFIVPLVSDQGRPSWPRADSADLNLAEELRHVFIIRQQGIAQSVILWLSCGQRILDVAKEWVKIVGKKMVLCYGMLMFQWNLSPNATIS